jgi:arylsulfatase A-like enzyme
MDQMSARERFARGLGQWPVVGGLAVLHLAGLLTAFGMAGPISTVSLGSKFGVVLLLGFLVLLELTLVVGAVAALETLASTPARLRLLDLVKSAGLAAVFALLAASLVKFSLTGSHLAVLDLWFLGSNIGQIAGESLGSERGIAILWLVGSLIGAGVLFVAFRRTRRRPSELVPRTWLLLLLLALIGALSLLLRYEDVRATARRVAPELGWVLGAAPGAPDGTSTAYFNPTDLVTLEGPRIEPYRAETPADARNVLLIMLESVPASVLDDPRARQAMPHLMDLAAESVVFTRAYAPSVHSDYAQMAVLSSLHPRKYRGHDFYIRLHYPRALLWDALAPAGWETAMFSCQNEEWGNMLAYLATPGLQTFRHSPDWPGAPRRGIGDETKVYEATVVDAWQGWLAQRGDAPWLAYLNFQATHFPYEIPPHAPRLFEPSVIDFPATFFGYPEDRVPVMRNRFLNALHYADRYVGEAVRVLKQRGEWDETILVVVADHGEAFYEHGHPTHGAQLFEEQVRSLFLARLPGEAPRAVDEPVALLDLPPSLLDRLGLPPHGNFQGRPDIFDTSYSARGRPFYFTIQALTDEDAVLLDDWKYIVNWRTGSRQLYHVASDPYETDDLARTERRRVRQMQARLEEFLTRQLAYYSQRGWEDDLYPEALP